MPQPSMRFISGVVQMGPLVHFTFNGKSCVGYAGESIASAMMRGGVRVLRRTRIRDQTRGYYCGMGLCWECAVHVEGEGVVRSCSHAVSEGMKISYADGSCE